MLKNLFTIFKSGNLMDKAYKRSFKMLAITKEMFNEARISLRDEDNSELDKKVYEQDVEINKFERKVRRNIINHLTVAGPEEIYSGLVLVSIIIDVERIGDYTKNMVDLAKQHPSMLKAGAFESDLKKVEKAVIDSFERVPEQFENSNVADAKKILKEYSWANRLCDKRVNDLVNVTEKDISCGDAVALALYFRYLKRINSHLRNIATSVVNPFDKIGFAPKKKKK